MNSNLPFNIIYAIDTTEKNNIPIAPSILHDLEYMNIMEKIHHKTNNYRRCKTEKNNKKIYLDNHPKDSIISKNVSAILLADRIKF